MIGIAHEFYASSPHLWLPLVGLALFLIVFLAQALRVMLQRSKSAERLAALPLDDDGATIAAPQRGEEHHA